MNRIGIIVCTALLIFNFNSYGQINYDEVAKEWILETQSMAYKLAVVNEKVHVKYYGAKLENPQITKVLNRPELAVRGGVANKTPAIEVIFQDGTRDLDMIFNDSDVINDNGYQILKIEEKDRHYGLTITSYYRVIPASDIIEKWIELKNTGDEDIKIEKAMSSSLWLPPNEYELTQFTGSLRREFQPKTALLTQGRKVIENRNFKSYSSSLFILRKEGQYDDYSGEVWYGQVHYSGNWAVEFDKQANGSLQILSGINYWDTEWNLKAHEVFITPKISFGYTDMGLSKVSQNYSGYIRDHILPQHGRGKVRPVLYNSWYATEFDINEKQQLELAELAKKIGVEMFVIDDGWFKGRIDDKGGLGDWTVDRNKFPNGLNPMIKEINKMGLEFGIWVEPEMVNPNSDLYREHPDWVLHFENRTRTTGRNQLMLNLAREDVYQYLHQSLHSLLKNHNIQYLKWDMNKELTEPGWPQADLAIQSEVRIRYVDNLYRLVDTLRSEFPDIWIETCSSGGGRVDIGMFNRMDVAWASDNIDPVDRIFIQDAYLTSFPANTMVSWTGHENWHGVPYTLEYRFDVAMSGVLGIGHDITKWSDEEIALAMDKVAQYKKNRETTHNGVLYKLASPFNSDRSILQFVNNDQTESVIYCYKLADNFKGSSTYPFISDRMKLQGLDPEKMYKLSGKDELYKGETLINQGIKFPLSNSYTSAIIRIEEMK